MAGARAEIVRKKLTNLCEPKGMKAENHNLAPRTPRQNAGSGISAARAYWQGVFPARPSTVARRRAAEHLGRDAEDAVAEYLQAQGCIILARRLRTKAGEIDLVAADADCLIFVEVKARRCLADAAYAVSPRQQARLLEAASLALAQNPGWARAEMRLDVALVAGATVEMLPDAIRYS